MAETHMATMLQVMEGRLGIQEVPGKKNNPIIVGWAKTAGHPEILDDETSWCSICMSSAAIEAALPCPPVNINPMARSWLTWGVAVAPEEVVPGDVCVWPRGNPAGPYGHVNIVKEVRRLESGKIQVRNIGGNQGGLAGGDAVTLSAWTDIAKALPNGIRRAVPATIADLRPHSTDIKKGDAIQNVGTAAGIGTVGLSAVESMLGPATVPDFKSLPEGLSWWQSVISGFQALGKLFLDHPWLAGLLVVALGLAALGHWVKKARVARHAAGLPIASQVAKLEAA